MTPAEFKALLPEFEGVPDATIQAWLDRSAPYFNLRYWGALYPDGLLYWVAHQLVLSGAASGGGSGGSGNAGGVTVSGDVTSAKVGDVTVTRSSSVVEKSASNPYLATKYGQEYLALANMIGAGAMAV
jgi:hypothetical protein